MPSVDALLLAVQNDDIDELDRLISAGGDVNAVDPRANLTLLGLATKMGKFEVQAYLELAGAANGVGAAPIYNHGSSTSWTDFSSGTLPSSSLPPPSSSRVDSVGARGASSPRYQNSRVSFAASGRDADSYERYDQQPLETTLDRQRFSGSDVSASSTRLSTRSRAISGHQQSQASTRDTVSKLIKLEKGAMQEKRVISRLEDSLTNEKKAVKQLAFQVKKNVLGEKQMMSRLQEMAGGNATLSEQIKDHDSRINECGALVREIGKLMETETLARSKAESSMMSDMDRMQSEASDLRESAQQAAATQYQDTSSAINKLGTQMQRMGDVRQ